MRLFASMREVAAVILVVITFFFLFFAGYTRFKAALTTDSPLIGFLDESAKWISTWRVKNGKNEDCTNKFKFIDGFLINIKAVQKLVVCLKMEENFSYLLTRRLCTDPVENLFCILRSSRGFEQNPSCHGFAQAFKHVIVN